MSLNANLTIDWGAVLAKAQDLAVNSVAQVALAKRVAMALATGTLANQADLIFADTRTVTASGTDTLDLVGGGLVDPFGVALPNIAKLKGLLVVASGTNVNNVNVTRPATQGVPLFLAAGDGIPVLPGGYFAWAAPNLAAIAVTGTTGDQIALVNSAAGSPVDYDIVIVGTSS